MNHNTSVLSKAIYSQIESIVPIQKHLRKENNTINFQIKHRLCDYI